MERLKKTSNNVVVDGGSVKSKCWGLKYHMTLITSVLVFLTAIVFLLPIIFRDYLTTDCSRTLAQARITYTKPPTAIVSDQENIPQHKDKLLGGLLSSGFDERSCVSRSESVLYIKGLQHKPSSYLISRLRRYEALHKQCGPYTEFYNKTVDLMRKSTRRYNNNNNNKNNGSNNSVCNYVIWISYSGLGNRMVSIASAFLYALLTNRVLLVDTRVNLPDLFCEPFPEVSWWLPSDFPTFGKFKNLNQRSRRSYGFIIKSNINAKIKQHPPPSIYLHLGHDSDDHDKSFFCDTDQTFLQNIPWLLLRSNNYFVPALFLIPSFKTELNNLFPDHSKANVFHFFGRYLFHPTNSVWGLITRYYNAYLAQADEKIGIQLRVFHSEINDGPNFKNVIDQILACTMKEHVLPQVKYSNDSINDSQPVVDINSMSSDDNNEQNKTMISVLITCLNRRYVDEIKSMYWENPSVTGEVVGVHQPSHEETQQTDKKSMHDRKAWTEMYLLSLTDKLVTSERSTFGYVAQGLGGLKPWILYKFKNKNKMIDPPCVRALSVEPCYHYPPLYDLCKKKSATDTSNIVPHVRHCEESGNMGLKLFDPKGEFT